MGEQIARCAVVGISLYSPQIDEITKGKTLWDPAHIVTGNAFLMQLPSSWGALFFPSAVRLFTRFYSLRTVSSLYDFAKEEQVATYRKASDPILDLPGARSNRWPRSWKRFFIDFMFFEGAVMLYPVLPRKASFSTTHVEPGEHTAVGGLAANTSENRLRRGAVSRKTVPLLKDKNELKYVLPPFTDLNVVDLYHRRSTLCNISIRAHTFRAHVRLLAQERLERNKSGDVASTSAMALASHRESALEDRTRELCLEGTGETRGQRQQATHGSVRGAGSEAREYVGG